MAGRTFIRQINGPGNRIKAEHVNELQVALEADDTRIDEKLGLADVQGVVQTELSNNPTVVAAAVDAAAAAVDAALTNEIYTAVAVDTLIAAQGAAINARRLVFPAVAGNRISALTHGAGLRRDTLTTVAMGAGQLRAQFVQMESAKTITEIGLDVTVAAAGSARLGVATWDFATRTYTLVGSDVEVDTGTTGGKFASVSIPVDAGWIALLSLYSANPGISGGEPATGFMQSTSGYPIACAIATGVPYGPLPASRTLNVDSTTILTQWVQVA